MSNFAIVVIYVGILVFGVYAFALWQERRHKHK